MQTNAPEYLIQTAARVSGNARAAALVRGLPQSLYNSEKISGEDLIAMLEEP